MSDNNQISGGKGNDTLSGNGGKDTFLWRDTITDFSIIDGGLTGDKIDLSNLLENETKDTISTYLSLSDDTTTDSELLVDKNADGTIDLTININGAAGESILDLMDSGNLIVDETRKGVIDYTGV